MAASTPFEETIQNLSEIIFSSFVGRKALLEQVTAVLKGDGSDQNIIEVKGEAGVGKTAFVKHLINSIVVSGRASKAGDSTISLQCYINFSADEPPLIFIHKILQSICEEMSQCSPSIYNSWETSINTELSPSTLNFLSRSFPFLKNYFKQDVNTSFSYDEITEEVDVFDEAIQFIKHIITRGKCEIYFYIDGVDQLSPHVFSNEWL